MGLCGYNEKIGAGILALVDGMIHAMISKELAEVDFRLTLQIEFEELRSSNEALTKRPDALGYLDGFLAVNRFAQVLFERVFDQLSDSGAWSTAAFASACRAEAKSLIDAMRDIDRKHRALKALEFSEPAELDAISSAINAYIEENYRGEQRFSAPNLVG